MRGKKYAYPAVCPTCGGPLTYSADGLEAACPFCGNRYNFRGGKTEAVLLALSRADAYRKNCDFEEAAREYSVILESCPEDAEAHWGLVLSRYGVEYVADENKGGLFPTCRKVIERSILSDENYLCAIKYAPEAQAQSYSQKAEEIDRLQREVKALSGRKCADVFMCYPEGGEESAAAERLGGELERRGITVFYSGKTCGAAENEPSVQSALYGCRYFILIVFSAQGLTRPRVKNQWSRFCDRAYEERLTDGCCAVYKNIIAAELPASFRPRAVNVADYPADGYETDIADNLKLLLCEGEARAEGGAAFAGGVSSSADELNAVLDEGRAALSRGDYVSAAAAYSRAIDCDGDCGEAWLGAFMSELEVRGIKSAKKFAQEISNRLWASGTTSEECARRLAANEHILYIFSSPYYKNAVRYSTSAMAHMLTDAMREVVDTAEKCNAALKLSLEQCRRRECSGYVQNNRQTDNGANGYSSQNASSAAAFFGGALAGGILGGIFGNRFARPKRRPPAPIFRHVPPPPSKRPFGGPHGRGFGGRGFGGRGFGGPRGRR